MPSVCLADDWKEARALCLGTGRFLRTVLVPLLDAPLLIQTRGTSFVDFLNSCSQQQRQFPVETQQLDGTIHVESVPCRGALTLADPSTVWEHVDQLEKVEILGVGVTEAGLTSETTMDKLYELLEHLRVRTVHRTLSVLDMDNVPNNGDVIRSHMMQRAANDPIMEAFLQNQVYFANTMVDRITSHRPGDPHVPRVEPSPLKPLVVLDDRGALPDWFTKQVLVRTTVAQLDRDVQCKLQIANGTHTALAHLLALLGVAYTNDLPDTLVVDYIDALVDLQILPVCHAPDVWQDWRRRLCHARLSSFFITQNGAQKAGIRLGPTVVASENIQISMAFAWAVLLRWLTPSSTAKSRIYRGVLAQAQTECEDETVVYADGMSYNLSEGWYEFQCDCKVLDGRPLPEALLAVEGHQPVSYVSVIRAYMLAPDGGNLGALPTELLETFVQATATLYARMKAGDDLLELLREMKEAKGPYTDGFASSCSVLAFPTPGKAVLHYRPHSIPPTSHLLNLPVQTSELEAVVTAQVASVQVIDLHTHLLPPTHGPLCLWGIDELLTYHYLVSEYFMTAPASMSPEKFFSLTKEQQADLIWNALFLDRSPLSEACRGILTALTALGLSDEVQRRDLPAIRAFYGQYRTDSEALSELVHAKAGVKYNIMTNVPFNSNEVQHWRPQRTSYTDRYRSALRVDPLLAGDRSTIEATLAASGYELTLEGARQYLRDWCDTMKPEYMMASTPRDFVVLEDHAPLSRRQGASVNEQALVEPGAFAAAARASGGCDGTEEDIPTAIDESSDFLSEVLMTVCEERDLPLALKIGAHRGVNPRLKAAGDGLVAFADAGVLGRLCARFPKVRFLATFLSMNNQHEACVLASKFRNLHIYGCWWYCNNPSLIQRITAMRVEMLGTSFTAQHSDARVLDQLLYKWPHSRAVIASVLSAEYQKLDPAWQLRLGDIQRDVERLFGKSYAEFMAKSLKE